MRKVILNPGNSAEVVPVLSRSTMTWRSILRWTMVGLKKKIRDSSREPEALVREMRKALAEMQRLDLKYSKEDKRITYSRGK